MDIKPVKRTQIIHPARKVEQEQDKRDEGAPPPEKRPYDDEHTEGGSDHIDTYA